MHMMDVVHKIICALIGIRKDSKIETEQLSWMSFVTHDARNNARRRYGFA